MTPLPLQQLPAVPPEKQPRPPDLRGLLQERNSDSADGQLIDDYIREGRIVPVRPAPNP